MRILLISGGFRRSCLGGIFNRILDGLGHDVQTFDQRKGLKLSDYEIGFFRKIWLYFRIRKNNRELSKIAEIIKPDLSLVIKGEYVFPKTLKTLKKYGLVFNFNPDDPFDSTNKTKWIIESLPVFDCYFIWDKNLMRKIKKFGAKRVEFLPFAFDPKTHRHVGLSKTDEEKYGCDICFVGTWEPQREKFLSGLTTYDLKVWGNAWQKTKGPLKNHIKGKAIYGEKFCSAVSGAKINLNFLRKQNRKSHNMRSFEIPACGGFQLATRSPFHKKFFGENVGIVCFENIKGMKDKIDHYLKHEKERKKIAKNGHEKIKNEIYENRVKKILKIYDIVSSEISRINP